MSFFDFFKIVYDEVFVFQLLAVSFSIVWVFYDWRKSKNSVIIGIAHIAGIFIIGTVLNWFLFALSSVWRGVAGIHFHIAWLLTILIYLGLFDRMRVTNRLIMGATVFITVIATADLGHEAMGCLKALFNGGYFDFLCYVADVLMIGFSFIIRRYSLKDYSDIPLVSVILIMITTVTSTVLIISKTVIKMSTGTFFEPYYCFVLAGIYIISVACYMMIYCHCKVRKEKTTLEVQNKLLEADKQMLVISKQAIEEMCALRHDMKNQHKVMELMLKERRYKDLEEFFSSADEKLNQSTMSEFIDCGNQLINSVINMEVLKATSYGVKLITKINVPDFVPIEASDLCRILVNLIDNAIEAILRTESRDYLVDIKIGKRTDYLYICVQNEIRDDIDRANLLKMNTVKDDAVNHGYGHKIVKRIVEKYNGYVNYTVVENEFIAEAMLDIKNSGGGVRP